MHKHTNTHHSIQQSKIKTEQSFVDNNSIGFIDNQRQEGIEKIQQAKHIVKWLQKRSKTSHLLHTEPERKENKTYSYFMVKLETISNLTFKKIKPQSKLFAHINCQLINFKKNYVYPKNVEMKILLEANDHHFELKETICYYFYTAQQKELNVRFEIGMIEQQIKQNNTQFYYEQEMIGTFEIDFLNDKRNKERKRIISKGQFNYFNKQPGELTSNSPLAIVSILRNDSYRSLEKLIPQHFICSSNDRIAGVMGSYLPRTQNSLADFAISSDAQRLIATINNIKIASNLLKDANGKVEQIAKSKYGGYQKLHYQIKSLNLLICFHNGWKQVSQGQSKLQQKYEGNIKTNNSLTTEQNHLKTKQNKSFVNKQENLIRYKSFSCQHPIFLNLVLPDQEECAIIFQVNALVEINGQILPKDKKETPLVVKQQLCFPISFSLLSSYKMMSHKPIKIKMESGSGLQSIDNIRHMITQQLKDVAILHKNEQKHLARLNKNTHADLDGISIVKTVKTIGNLSNHSIKAVQPQFKYGVIMLQLHTQQRQEQNRMSVDNISILDNFSNLNISKHDLKDKIGLQKQRMWKEGKKNVVSTKNNKNKIEFMKIIDQLAFDQKKQLKTLSQKQKSKKIRNQKEKLLVYVKTKLLDMDFKDADTFSDQLKGVNESKLIKFHQNIFYRIKVQEREQKHYFELLKIPICMSLFVSNDNCSAIRYFSRSHNFYEQVPDEIIRTELMQLKYCNCLFFNFVSVSEGFIDLVMFPKSFYFRFNFWTFDLSRTNLMTINSDTGQIIVGGDHKQEQAKSKILHFEVVLDEEVSNKELLFIDFIRYLYNGILQIEMIDQTTNFIFGIFYLPLRDLLRRRRNEVSVVYEDNLYLRNQIKGRMKMEVKNMRKEVYKIKQEVMKLDDGQKEMKENLIETSLKQIIKIEDQNKKQNDRRIQRISKFKLNQQKKQIQNLSPNHKKKPIHIEKAEQSRIGNLINKKYFIGQRTLKVTRLKKQFLFLQVSNKHNYEVSYQLLLNDEHSKYFTVNHLSVTEEITVVKDYSLLDQNDLKDLRMVKNYNENLMKCKKLNEEDFIILGPKQKCQVLLCYLSVRKYMYWQQQDQQELLVFYNKRRTINCSVMIEKTGNVEAIYAINIIPVPDIHVFHYEFYRPCDQKSEVHLPFIHPKYLSQNIDNILVDDPYSRVFSIHYSNTQPNNSPTKNNNRIQGSGLIVSFINAKLGESKQITLSILSDNVQKNEKNSKQKNINPLKIRAFNDYQNSASIATPKIINIHMKMWGCFKIKLKADLWQDSLQTFQLPNEMFYDAKNRQLNYFYLLSDDEKTLKFSNSTHKISSQHHQLLQVNRNVKKTTIKVIICAHTINRSYIHINAVNPESLNENQKSIQNESHIFAKIVAEIDAIIPAYKQLLKININSSGQQLILQQSFIYENNFSKQMQFKVMSSHPQLTWVKPSDKVFQINSKQQKKMTIYFNVENIMLNKRIIQNNEIIVLGFKNLKNIQYFGFKFNVY